MKNKGFTPSHWIDAKRGPCTGECCREFPIPGWEKHMQEWTEYYNKGGGEPVREINRRILQLVRPVYGTDKYTCTAWDSTTKLCTVYETRPRMCERYPYGDRVCQYCGARTDAETRRAV